MPLSDPKFPEDEDVEKYVKKCSTPLHNSSESCEGRVLSFLRVSSIIRSIAVRNDDDRNCHVLASLLKPLPLPTLPLLLTSRACMI